MFTLIVFVPNLINNYVDIAAAEPLTIKGEDIKELQNSTKSSFSIENKNVNYYNKTSGYLAYPIIENNTKNLTDKKLPGIIMIHEWWGLNENIKNMANSLAKEGYVVLAVDLYNGQVTDATDIAKTLVSKVRDNPSEAINNLQSAVRYLASLENVNSSKIASLGWCFGGGQSLQLALNTEPDYPLAATIIYYGNLVSDQESISKIKWPVLGIFGDQDQSISVNDVKNFEKILTSTGVPNEIYIYEGVGHAFANPSGDNYAPKETADAWQKTLDFLNKYIK
ncbi:MAG TPA: dienelactone hydrolase family protein [Nitrososphaeraceae archaeon]|nr:dienelactone hydrolase family protein [Nitrososphaeraceae archaeon]